MSLPVAVLAGGLATRLGETASRVPKSLVDVAGRPFAVRQVELLQRHGLTDIVFLVGHLGELVQETLGDGSRWNVRLRYVFDGPQPRGTAGAVMQALPALGEAFFVLYGDSYLECDYRAVECAFLASNCQALMTVCRNDGRWDRSNVRFEAGRVLRYDKMAPTPDMQHIDYGLGAFRRAAFGRYSSDGGPLDLAQVYEDLLARGELVGYNVDGRFYEIGSPAGLEETCAYLARGGTGA